MSNSGPILVFPWIHPVGCDVGSSPGRLHSRQATAWNCEKICSVFRHEILSNFNNTQKSYIHTEFTQCVLLWQLLYFFSILLQLKILIRWVITIEENFVLITLSTSEELDCPITTRSLRSFVKGFIFFTHFCDCSVLTELIYRSNCAKNGVNRFQIDTIVNYQFFSRLCFWVDLGTIDS